MGVAPYSWPHEREWKPGLYDKRANLGIWFALIVYSIFYIGITLNIGPELLFGELLFVFLFLTCVLAILVAFFIVGQTVRRDVRVEEIKYFDIPPERLSEVVYDLLMADSIHHTRDGPHIPREDYWLDTFTLIGPHWDGITLVVERNPLIARVDLACVTIRGMSRSTEQINDIEERIDGVAMGELLDRYEGNIRRDRPNLVLYGDDAGGFSNTKAPVPTESHKPYEPRDP
ncbi:MAG: hypothetical protein JSW25_03470 [Thermoplasmata archaeon]|nr:MAG: hypothetical protein JSW25_03470 [Thermoplasmata archaeon]